MTVVRTPVFVSPQQLKYQFSEVGPVGIWRLVVRSKNGLCTSNEVTINVLNAEPAPQISSLNPTCMNAGAGPQTLSIFGAYFSKGNIVQFRWGVPPNQDVWNTAKHSANVLSSNYMTIVMDPGSVSDNIFVRICRSATEMNPTDISSGYQYVQVIGSNPVPEITGGSPTTLPANGIDQNIIINGTNFAVGNRVRVKRSAGNSSGGWTLGNIPTIVSPTEMVFTLNPGQVEDTVVLRVCRSASQSTDADSSTGQMTIPVSVAGTIPFLTSINHPSIPVGNGMTEISLYGTHFTVNSYHQISYDGGISWGSASVAPKYISNNELRIQVDDRLVRTIMVRVCPYKGSSMSSNALAFAITSSAVVVKITPPNASIQAGKTLALTVAITGTSNNAVTWSVIEG